MGETEELLAAQGSRDAKKGCNVDKKQVKKHTSERKSILAPLKIKNF